MQCVLKVSFLHCNSLNLFIMTLNKVLECIICFSRIYDLQKICTWVAISFMKCSRTPYDKVFLKKVLNVSPIRTCFGQINCQEEFQSTVLLKVPWQSTMQSYPSITNAQGGGAFSFNIGTKEGRPLTNMYQLSLGLQQRRSDCFFHCWHIYFQRQ